MPKPKKGHPWAYVSENKIAKCVACGHLFKKTLAATSACLECQRRVRHES